MGPSLRQAEELPDKLPDEVLEWRLGAWASRRGQRGCAKARAAVGLHKQPRSKQLQPSLIL
jgi:hypothetical protein